MNAPNPQVVRDLNQRAREAAAAGDEATALATFRSLLEVAPGHLGALSFLAMHAFRAGDYTSSLHHMDEALRIAAHDPVLLRNRAAVRAACGQISGAAEDLGHAEYHEPTNPLNPLQRGAIHQDAGDLDSAIEAYDVALTMEPRIGDPRLAALLPPPLDALAERRRIAIRDWLTTRFEAALAAARAAHPDLPLTHAEETLRLHREERPLQQVHPKQRPHELFVPDLKPQPFCTRDQLPWAAALEAETAAIRAEYLAVAGGEGFEPYIDKPPEQSEAWLKLAGKPDWNSFFLYQKAAPNTDNLARCPRTAAALAAVPVCRVGDAPTELFFSVLAPGAHIPPHYGLTNAKCVVHLPLIVPPGGKLRVADETHAWREGEVVAFDDSFEHEAQNPGAEPRVVLICEVWNPQLNAAEVMAISGMLDAIHAYKHRAV